MEDWMDLNCLYSTQGKVHVMKYVFVCQRQGRNNKGVGSELADVFPVK